MIENPYLLLPVTLLNSPNFNMSNVDFGCELRVQNTNWINLCKRLSTIWQPAPYHVVVSGPCEARGNVAVVK